MNVFEAGGRLAKPAPAKWFTGTAWQDAIIEAPPPARVRALRVAFEPRARTNWHTHPLGQTLYVTEGVGLVARRGHAPRLIRAGDTVWIPPGEEHWHGASSSMWLVHIAIQEADETGAAHWLEPVSDEDYAH